MQTVHARLTESARDALADINDNIGGARLSRVDAVEEGYQALEQASTLQIVGAAGVGKSAVLQVTRDPAAGRRYDTCASAPSQTFESGLRASPRSPGHRQSGTQMNESEH